MLLRWNYLEKIPSCCELATRISTGNGLLVPGREPSTDNWELFFPHAESAKAAEVSASPASPIINHPSSIINPKGSLFHRRWTQINADFNRQPATVNWELTTTPLTAKAAEGRRGFQLTAGN